MPSASAGAGRGRTDWRRFAVVTVVSVSASAAVLTGMGEGALAASFQVSGQSFAVSFDHLTGEGFQQYAAVDAGADGAVHPVAQTGIRRMTARRMCQSVAVPLPAVGDVVLRMTAGDRGEPVTARNLVVDTETLRAEAEFTGVEIGRDAGTVRELPGGTGPAGAFAQRADRVEMSHLRQRARAATAGTFLLPDLSMRTGTDVPECR
ncbi:DUF6230 family protein [Streptomyces sp. NPDC059506]|uniref:DUF6230 family protein n=1 Tax=Streptomyces TaxID=1883 RepID=UPI0015F95CE9|nr:MULTISPECIES: DUF6230 family protein [unclassified Streptomyces]MCZ2523503.1 DUF6230 family protein [Streptomyces sp. HB2AG]QMV20581.1 cholesterol esterase [Streptomyces sp. SCUT-3]